LVKRKGRLIFFVAAAVLAAVSLVIYMNVHRAPEKRKQPVQLELRCDAGGAGGTFTGGRKSVRR